MYALGPPIQYLANGFIFTHEKLRDFDAKFRKKKTPEGKSDDQSHKLPDDMKGRYRISYEWSGLFKLQREADKHRLGEVRGIVIPKRMDVPGAVTEDGFQRAFFLLVKYEPFCAGDTEEHFREISFDESDEEVNRILEWFVNAGYATKEEMKARWMTLSPWSFREQPEEEIPVGGY